MRSGDVAGGRGGRGAHAQRGDLLLPALDLGLHEQRAALLGVKALDALHLPDSTVLMDALYGFPVVLASDHPKQFVQTTDRDFAEVLDRPVESGIRYLVTVPDKARGRSDALNRRYPGIYDDGARIGRLVFQADSDGPDPPFRVYKLDPKGAQAAAGLTP